MKIQMDIPKELNKKLKLEKIERDEGSLRITVIRILDEYLNQKEAKNGTRNKR